MSNKTEERNQQSQPQQRSQIPYWIPKDIFLPASSRSSITTSSISNNDGSSSSNLVGEDHEHSNSDLVREDVSSVWSLSTTSELTFHSHNEIPSATLATQTGPASQVVEATYQDLERVAAAFGPSLVEKTPVAYNIDSFPVIVEALQDPVDEGEEEEEEPLFDPFLIQTQDATATFPEFYNTATISSEKHDVNEYKPDVKNEVSSDSQGESLLLNHLDSSADEVFSATEKSCTPSLRRLDKQQRRHSDLGCNASWSSTSGRKRRVLVPLHARMETIAHQSQKPFRTVSRMIAGSIHRLHDRMTRPMSPRRIASAPPKNRFEIFRRNSEMNVAHDYQYEESSVSSLPDLRNVDSSETEATPPLPIETEQIPSWDKDEVGQENVAEQCVAQFMLDVEPRAIMEIKPAEEPAQFMVDEEPRASVAANPRDCDEMGEHHSGEGKIHRAPWTPNTSRDHDDDLRWLFARQQLPAYGSFDLNESRTSEGIEVQTQASI